MAEDIVLKLGDMKGEAVEPGYEDWITLHAWSWGATQSGTTHEGMGGGGGKVSMQDLTGTKMVDSATHDILKHVCNGKHIDSAELVALKAAGDAPLPFLRIELKNIIVTSYQTAGAKDGQDRISETFTLNFEEVKVTYTQQNADGSAGAESSFGWNNKQNIEV